MIHQGSICGVTRRRLLELGARGALMFPLTDLNVIAGGESTARWSSARLDAAQALRVDPAQFLSAGQLRARGVELDALGLRATGSTAEHVYVDALASRLERAGVQQLRFESVPFRRWSPNKWSLAVVSSAGAGPKNVAAYVPYSGSTSTAWSELSCGRWPRAEAQCESSSRLMLPIPTGEICSASYQARATS